MQPPYLAEKLPELSDSEAKQAFQLVFIKHSVFAIISALLWFDVTKKYTHYISTKIQTDIILSRSF